MKEDQPQDYEVVKGSISVSNTYAKALFYPRASHSFISAKCTKSLLLGTYLMPLPLVVITPRDGRVVLRNYCKGCPINIVGYEHEFEFILLDMIGYEVIIGMDWKS